MVTTHRFTIENGHAFFSTLFSRNRVEASVFLLSATNGNNRLVITRKFRTRDLLSPSRIIGGKKISLLPPFFPRCKFRSRKRIPEKTSSPTRKPSLFLRPDRIDQSPSNESFFSLFFLPRLLDQFRNTLESLKTRKIVGRMCL